MRLQLLPFSNANCADELCHKYQCYTAIVFYCGRSNIALYNKSMKWLLNHYKVMLLRLLPTLALWQEVDTICFYRYFTSALRLRIGNLLHFYQFYFLKSKSKSSMSNLCLIILSISYLFSCQDHLILLFDQTYLTLLYTLINIYHA